MVEFKQATTFLKVPNCSTLMDRVSSPRTRMKGITNTVVNMDIAPGSNSVCFSTEMCGRSLGWKIFKFLTFLGPGLNDSFFGAQNV